jgi:hypothetical protein
MSLDLTPEQIKNLGEMWGDVLVPTIPLEERLANTNPSEVINLFKEQNQLAKLSFSEIEEFEEHLKKLKQQKKGKR